MKITAVPRAVLHLQYQAVRLPVGALDTRVLGGYLPEESALRLSLQRALGSLDTAAGRLLDDQTLQRRGTALRQRSAALTQAAQLEHDAQRRRGHADHQLTAASEGAADRRAQAQREHREAVEQAVGEEQKDKRRVTEQAQARAETATDRTETAAKERLDAVDAQRRAEQTRIDTRKQQAAAGPKAALKAAAGEKSDAAKRRGDADRLNQLATGEHRQRRRA